jgi:hypothetical protein
MFIYKSKCRFPFIIVVNNKVIEVFPNQVIESQDTLDYPNLILMENENEPKKLDERKTNRKN